MENVVPGALQRLRAADIFRMAGLAAASLGQEYSRSGAVHSTHRQGARITGIVDVAVSQHYASNTGNDGSELPSSTEQFPGEVEVTSPTSWSYTCTCGSHTPTLCAHTAALLYQWIAQPTSFLSTTPSTPALPAPASTYEKVPSPVSEALEPSGENTRSATISLSAKATPAQRTAVPLGSLAEILGALSLGELRGIAREYDLLTNGLNKQQLVEVILAALQKTELVRRVASTLEKPQRQLLAALTLLGGVIADEDLRGLFERFSLGPANQFQLVLLGLQNKALLFRTSLNSSSQQRIGLSGSLLDVGWYVPVEVRTALHVSVPVTVFDVDAPFADTPVPTVQLAPSSMLLEDMLLVARALDGYDVGKLENWLQLSQGGVAGARAQEYFPAARLNTPLSSDGSCTLPPPSDTPPAALIASLQELIPHAPAYLRFVVRLLRLAELVDRDEASDQRLSLPADLAALLLGPGHNEALNDLFTLWLRSSSYSELFELQEEGLRLRCRATALQVPIIRPGELDAENSEARQVLLALLTQTPAGQWISFSAFAVFMYRLNPLFLQRRQRLYASPHWWIEQESGRALRPLQRNEWLRAEGYYLSRLLSGPLHWWGLCDLARSAEGRLLAFRLTPLAVQLLQKKISSAEMDTPVDDLREEVALEIVGASELLVACTLQQWPLIQVLELFTESAGVRNGRLLYRLTPRALARALRRGHSPSRLLALLEAVAASTEMHTDLHAMLAQVERWCASYGRIRVYTGVTLLETADMLVMRELSATTSIDEQVVRSLQPTMLILKKSGAERIVEELKRRGQSPLLHDEDIYGAE